MIGRAAFELSGWRPGVDENAMRPMEAPCVLMDKRVRIVFIINGINNPIPQA
jgi:hypothetical protein